MTVTGQGADPAVGATVRALWGPRGEGGKKAEMVQAMQTNGSGYGQGGGVGGGKAKEQTLPPTRLF